MSGLALTSCSETIPCLAAYVAASARLGVNVANVAKCGVNGMMASSLRMSWLLLPAVMRRSAQGQKKRGMPLSSAQV